MKKRVAAIQLCSGTNPDKNFVNSQALISEASSNKASLACLPENFAFLADDGRALLEVAEELNKVWLPRYLGLAKDHQIWLSLGGFPTLIGSQKVFNSHLIVNPQGQICAKYDKIHLFTLQIPAGPDFDESRTTEAGNKLVMSDSPIGKLGLSICYDIRFGEMFTQMAAGGAQTMLIPAAFTQTTGKVHWEILLRARAIESQSYVVAAAQVGQNTSKRHTHGHSMVVDPWGTIVAQCSEGPGLVLADIDLNYVNLVRARMPVLANRWSGT